ncbi:hypothetical protein H8356DRAFT_1647490 [Neocallimastix lanati (nom. inval.)]|jgi:predicted nucleic acid binding AN1-type Zn finger protein|uniref:AN1-type domain-containing protein n=1 Tax=Neocallimastix californiae TaxID=1754190 RepID=A0A1Y2AGA9_9FUNG|nr:hypothetical protein H8356DRAFT_1647490 [Neocallimastix sp. JGI-2020a]ORY21619.1 hypothetical protein LY90DRAFT_707394 [Neocallimastix californiae]|eukprot:ORY21619.1 hypothetical protein LY90DRAFT_707394 [Neocallimastix californiae]
MDKDSLMSIGVHCAVENCNKLDFLPFQCSACHFVYCLDHRLPTSHNCTKWSSIDKYLPVCNICQNILKVDEEHQLEIYKKHLESKCQLYVAQPVNTKIKCDFENCGVEELLATFCRKCHKNYCLKHRHPIDHKCTQVEKEKIEADLKKQEIKNLIQNNFKNSTASTHKTTTPAIKKKGKKLNPKIELIKMKAKAKGDAGIPMKCRKYFRIYYPLNSKNESENLPLYFNESWSIGRILDKAADIGKIVNKNNSNVREEKLNLYGTTNNGNRLPMSDNLLDLINSKVIQDGESLILERGDMDSVDIANYF